MFVYRLPMISIHALLAESDRACQPNARCVDYFYPRSPCGERPPKLSRVVPTPIFLSTLSLRRATTAAPFDFIQQSFLSTLSLRRATSYLRALLSAPLFLSTLSLRRATSRDPAFRYSSTFLSTLSLRRATAKVHKTVGHFCAYETNFMEIASSC